MVISVISDIFPERRVLIEKRNCYNYYEGGYLRKNVRGGYWIQSCAVSSTEIRWCSKVAEKKVDYELFDWKKNQKFFLHRKIFFRPHESWGVADFGWFWANFPYKIKGIYYIVDRTPDWHFGTVIRKSGKMTLFCLQTQFSFVSRIFSLIFQQSNCMKLQLQKSCQRQFPLGVRKRP